jgi:hypothetical protein
VALAVDQHTDLAARLVREFCQLARKFLRHNLVRRDAPRIEFLNAAQLVGFQTERVS